MGIGAEPAKARAIVASIASVVVRVVIIVAECCIDPGLDSKESHTAARDDGAQSTDQTHAALKPWNALSFGSTELHAGDV